MKTSEIFKLFHDLCIPIDFENDNFSFTDNVVLLSNVLSSITSEIRTFYGLELTVSPITDKSEKMSIYMDLSGFLREIECPYSVLIDGSLESRFSTEFNINLLLGYLLTELMSVRINAVQHYDKCDIVKPSVDMQEVNTSLTLITKSALIALGLGRPPDNMTVDMFFNKFQNSLTEKMQNIPKHFLGKSLMSQVKPLTEDQWCQVDLLINSINDDYYNRKQTLIQRFDVTVQSLKWSPKALDAVDKIIKVLAPARTAMDNRNIVTVVDVLASRDNPLTIYEKTCTGLSREMSKCALNRLMIGKVPDRGGRPNEMEPPPPEAPAFQKRDNSAVQQQNFGNRVGGQSERGGFQNRGEGRGRNQGHVSDRLGYQGQGDSGGYQSHGDRGGYQSHGDRGGYQNQGDRRGNAYRVGSRGGHQGQETYDHRGYGQGGMMGQNYRDQPDIYAQSVAPNNFHGQNDFSQPFRPQYKPPAQQYKEFIENPRRGQR